jgi:hypothetical protein
MVRLALRRSARSMNTCPAARMACAKIGMRPSSFFATNRTDAGTWARSVKTSKID